MVLSLVLAVVTTTARSRPRRSVRMPRLRPTIFLPASMPWVLRGALVGLLHR